MRDCCDQLHMVIGVAILAGFTLALSSCAPRQMDGHSVQMAKQSQIIPSTIPKTAPVVGADGRIMQNAMNVLYGRDKDASSQDCATTISDISQ